MMGNALRRIGLQPSDAVASGCTAARQSRALSVSRVMPAPRVGDGVAPLLPGVEVLVHPTHGRSAGPVGRLWVNVQNRTAYAGPCREVHRNG